MTKPVNDNTLLDKEIMDALEDHIKNPALRLSLYDRLKAAKPFKPKE